MALEHTLEDLYAASAITAQPPTGLRRRVARSERQLAGVMAWPFRGQAYVAAVEQVRDAVLFVDRSGTLRYANGAGRALLEHPRPEGRHLLDLLELDAGFLRRLLRGLPAGAPWRGATTIEVAGRSRALELSISAVTVNGGPRTHGFSVVAEITQGRSSARDVLATMLRVAGSIAHDFNNQIAVVLNYSFILLREPTGEPAGRAHVEELQRAAWRAADTAKHLLRLSDKRSRDPSALDVNDTIRQAHAALSLIARAHGDLELRLSPETCWANTRQSELEWLLLALAQRLRARLGDLRLVRITTTRATGDQLVRGARVRLCLEGFPAVVNSAHALSSDLEDPEARKLSEQLGCELDLQPLSDDGLRYAVELPGV